MLVGATRGWQMSPAFVFGVPGHRAHAEFLRFRSRRTRLAAAGLAISSLAKGIAGTTASTGSSGHRRRDRHHRRDLRRTSLAVGMVPRLPDGPDRRGIGSGRGWANKQADVGARSAFTVRSVASVRRRLPRDRGRDGLGVSPGLIEGDSIADVLGLVFFAGGSVATASP